MYKITLDDGTVLDNLRLNGSNFISNEPVSSSTFEGKLSSVIIDDGENIPVIHTNMQLVQIAEYAAFPGEYFFILAEESEAAKNMENYKKFFGSLADKQMDDTEASEFVYIFPEWDPNGVSYKAGTRVTYNGKLARCLQDHVSQADWAPGVAVSLWAWTSDPAEQWPEWVQPLGAHDAYAKGAKVSHNGKHWISDIDANVWEPGVSQWTEVTEEE